jgi:hypothetical protein
MPEEDAFKAIEKDLGSFEYVGEILATIRYHELATVKEVIEYYYKLWEVTEGLTDEELQKDENKTIEINPGGFGHTYVKGQKSPKKVGSIIESLRSQERYIESILLALKKEYPRKFPKDDRFNETLKPTP